MAAKTLKIVGQANRDGQVGFTVPVVSKPSGSCSVLSKNARTGPIPERTSSKNCTHLFASSPASMKRNSYVRNMISKFEQCQGKEAATEEDDSSHGASVSVDTSNRDDICCSTSLAAAPSLSRISLPSHISSTSVAQQRAVESHINHLQKVVATADENVVHTTGMFTHSKPVSTIGTKPPLTKPKPPHVLYRRSLQNPVIAGSLNVTGDVVRSHSDIERRLSADNSVLATDCQMTRHCISMEELSRNAPSVSDVFCGSVGDTDQVHPGCDDDDDVWEDEESDDYNPITRRRVCKITAKTLPSSRVTRRASSCLKRKKVLPSISRGQNTKISEGTGTTDNEDWYTDNEAFEADDVDTGPDSETESPKSSLYINMAGLRSLKQTAEQPPLPPPIIPRRQSSIDRARPTRHRPVPSPYEVVYLLKDRIGSMDCSSSKLSGGDHQLSDISMRSLTSTCPTKLPSYGRSPSMERCASTMPTSYPFLSPSAEVLQSPSEQELDSASDCSLDSHDASLHQELVPHSSSVSSADVYTCSTLCGSEPLYQIYHQGAVIRCVIEQNSDFELDGDSVAADDYAECVTDILKRSTGHSGVRVADVTPSFSTLETAIRAGNTFKRMWGEMQKVRDTVNLDALNMDERRLQEAQFEIISSEMSYLKSMNLLVGHFMANLGLNVDRGKESIMTRDDFNRLFSNARAVRDVSVKMVSALDRLWQLNCVLDPSSVGRVITDIAQKYFHVYVLYCSNAIYQERKLRQLLEQKPEFQYAVLRLEETAECQSLPLASFLALPMQRITRMPLLVGAICQRIELTTGNISPPELSQCLCVLQKIVQQCNDGARKMSNLEQIMEIDKVIDFKTIKRVPLVSKSRFLVKKGPLTQLLKPTSGFRKKTKRTLHFFLFNDLLLITKKRAFRERPYEVVEHTARMHVHAEAIADKDIGRWLPYNITGSGYNPFYLVLMDKQVEFILSTESLSERTRWIQAVTPPESDNENERVYEDWDCPQVQAIARYVATEPDELSLEESDIVNVFRKLSDGWFYGERIRDNECGWFPAQRTVEIQNAHVRARNLRQQFRFLRRVSD